MTLHRFYVLPEQITPQQIRIRGDDAAQIRRVLRLKEGASLAVFDGSGREILGRITAVTASEVHAEPVSTSWPKTELPYPLILLQALLKGEKMDWVIEKATELGAASVRVFPAARSVVQMREERAERKTLRWTRIAKEAAEQCGRVRVPTVELLPALTEALTVADLSACFIADEARGRQESEAEGDTLPTDFPAVPPASSRALLVGPEGGWTPEERSLALEQGAQPLSLGPRILRAETAAIVGLARLAYGMPTPPPASPRSGEG